MTDFEKVKALFDELGVGYKAGADKWAVKQRTMTSEAEWQDRLLIEPESVGGSYIIFSFDINGKFIEVGAWE